MIKISTKENLETQIQKVDRNWNISEFGLYAINLFKKQTPKHIKPIIDYIYKNYNLKNISILDVGGAKGIVAKEILKELPKYNITIDITDIDNNKFPNKHHKNITYIKHNAIDTFKKQYDIVFARAILHYNTYSNQEKIIENIVKATKINGLIVLIQPLPESAEYREKINKFYDFITDLKKSNKKYWPILSEIIKPMYHNNLKIINIEKIPTLYTLNNYYKGRYDLNNIEIELLEQLLNQIDLKEISLPTHIISAKKYNMGVS